jgi:hypothetical protein
MPEECTTPDLVDTVRLYFQTIASDWDFDAVAGLSALADPRRSSA